MIALLFFLSEHIIHYQYTAFILHKTWTQVHSCSIYAEPDSLVDKGQ